MGLAGPADHFSRGAAAGFIGQAAWAAGDLDTAVDTFSSAVDSLEAAGMRADALGATVVLAQMWLGRGEPQQAQSLYEHALAAATSHPGPTLSTTGDLYVGLADVLREEGELAAAEENLQAARALGDRASLPENRHRWFTTAAGLRRVHGDLEGAVAMLDRAEQLYLPGYFPDLRPIPATRARVWVAMGRLRDARGWANRRGLSTDDPVTYLNEYDLLTLARLLTAEGAHREAVGLLDRVVEGAHAASRNGSTIEARLVRALAHRAAGDTEAAVADIAAALALAAPAGYCRLFLDEGPMAVELLTRLADAGIPGAQALARQVLDRAAASATTRDSTESTDSATAYDVLGAGALSDRELEVLRLLATELSGPDIARRLFVSVNTLRTHTKHIFTKLDVNTRRGAVRRATELHLL
jgi:LuxR family maltose regulon positive regulatory protein